MAKDGLRFAFTGPQGNALILSAARKVDLEKLFGELTDEEYLGHVIGRTFPEGAPADLIQLPDDWTPPREGTEWRLVNGEVVALEPPQQPEQPS